MFLTSTPHPSDFAAVFTSLRIVLQIISMTHTQRPGWQSMLTQRSTRLTVH